MKKLKKLFFIKEYSLGYTNKDGIKTYDKQYYCYYCEWNIRIINFYFFKTMFIRNNGYSISVFNNKIDAYLFIKNKREEYINAKKYIRI